MTKTSILPGEALMFWTLMRRAREAHRAGQLTADLALDVRDTLNMIARYTECDGLRKRCGRGVMELRRMREALAA